MTVLVVVLVGLMGGAAAGFQAPLAAMIGRHVGIGGSIFIVHIVGTVCAAALLLIPGSNSIMANWRNVPWYALLTGVLGILLVGTVSFCVPRIGAASTITLMIVGNLLIGATLDHYGILVDQVRSLDTSRVLGVGAVLIGTWLIVR
jgi:transporter family-2 protein